MSDLVFIQVVFVAGATDAFDLIPDCIKAVSSYVGERFVKERTAYSILIEGDLFDENKKNILDIAKKGKIGVFFIYLPKDFAGNGTELIPKSVYEQDTKESES
jgi:hypothetical protein